MAMGLAVAVMIIFSMILLLLSENIIGIFNNEPTLVKLGSIFLRIALAGYLGMSVVYIMQNCISGSGDTMPPMIISMVTLWIVQLPLAYLLSRFTGLGMYGVRWAIVAGFVVGAIAYMIYFWQGRWKRKKV
jgi:Na+-driven multidrug efflux pump